MKEKLADLLKSIFGICLAYSVLVGALVAAMYVIGFIIGGSAGQQLAIFGAKIMKYAITISAAGSVIGMGAFYIENSHELKMDSDQ